MRLSTARGLDGVSLADLLAIGRDDLLQVINGIFEWFPERVNRGRITLIPKKNNPVHFGDYRPICVLPLVVRILHRIPAKRLDAAKHHALQAGFVEGRCTSENIWLVNTILGSQGRAKLQLMSPC